MNGFEFLNIMFERVRENDKVHVVAVDKNLWFDSYAENVSDCLKTKKALKIAEDALFQYSQELDTYEGKTPNRAMSALEEIKKIKGS